MPPQSVAMDDLGLASWGKLYPVDQVIDPLDNKVGAFPWSHQFGRHALLALWNVDPDWLSSLQECGFSHGIVPLLHSVTDHFQIGACKSCTCSSLFSSSSAKVVVLEEASFSGRPIWRSIGNLRSQPSMRLAVVQPVASWIAVL